MHHAGNYSSAGRGPLSFRSHALIQDRDVPHASSTDPRRGDCNAQREARSVTRPLFVGVAGGSGSGKTTIARRIAAGLAPAMVAHVDMDAYYKHRTDLTLDERRRVNWDHPDALDVDLFVTQLDALGRREAVPKPVYDYATHLRRDEPETVDAADAVIV